MTPRVLVVEDDPSVRTLLDSLLSGEGYDVRTASDGTAAMQIAHEHVPSLILLDVMMPDLGGVRVLEQLRTDEALTGIPVVVVTGAIDLVPLLREQLGEEHVFIKPFVVADMLDQVARLTGGPVRRTGKSS
jgi:CheY-like chemotaxis protein